MTQRPGAMHGRSGTGRGFTMIELLTVVAVIGLLISILIPALNRVTARAKVTKTKATMRAIEGGLELFKADSTIGGQYPPSASDNPTQFGVIGSPLYGSALYGTSGPNELKVSGAHLLVAALLGFDLLNTPGFDDLDGDGQWWDDQRADAATVPGAYYIDGTTNEPARPRFGPFVQSNTKTRTNRELGRLGKVTAFLSGFPAGWHDETEIGSEHDLPMFVDAFEYPIVYYRARRAASNMVTDPSGDPIGIYDYRDNFDIVSGLIFTKPHRIATSPSPPIGSAPAAGTFARYIWNDSITARPTPVRRETFLLMSPGEDGIFGTKDDIKNWE